MSRDANNLTGIWQGLYSYPQALAPVSFTATLLESGAWLSGSIHEIAREHDGAPVEVYATLLGGRDGRGVQFTKTYDGTNGWVHAVAYDGALNDDATEIEGRWSVPGAWAGKFLMIRPEGRRAGQLREAFERF
ncbi:hypothetical protein [Caulobacter soli]|uniref:hypothetical protein n=1 Tax=Caulobacter soli TaxID=2708539 RepID=UPI0013ED4209|nr:hypothetical protein [Caulobacter soli]